TLMEERYSGGAWAHFRVEPAGDAALDATTLSIYYRIAPDVDGGDGSLASQRVGIPALSPHHPLEVWVALTDDLSWDTSYGIVESADSAAIESEESVEPSLASSATGPSRACNCPEPAEGEGSEGD